MTTDLRAARDKAERQRATEAALAAHCWAKWESHDAQERALAAEVQGYDDAIFEAETETALLQGRVVDGGCPAPFLTPLTGGGGSGHAIADEHEAAAAPTATTTRSKPCTCDYAGHGDREAVGVCRGADGLGESWYCQHPSPPATTPPPPTQAGSEAGSPAAVAPPPAPEVGR